MVNFLVAVRNFTIAVLLAWMGFSVAPESADKEEANSGSPSNAISSIFVR
ncbi:MAG: hypothetical protein ACE37M_00500 [Henriciella sp.]